MLVPPRPGGAISDWLPTVSFVDDLVLVTADVWEETASLMGFERVDRVVVVVGTEAGCAGFVRVDRVTTVPPVGIDVVIIVGLVFCIVGTDVVLVSRVVMAGGVFVAIFADDGVTTVERRA